MGLIQTLLNKKDEIFTERKINAGKKSKPSYGNSESPEDTLENEDEVDRLSKYISPENQKKIINKKTALKYGINHIGDLKDCDFFDMLKNQTSSKAKDAAAKFLVKKWARDNITGMLKTKTGKEIAGRAISKNVYIKEVSYQRAGKTISYLQARNIKTGQVVGYKAALSLIGKYGL